MSPYSSQVIIETHSEDFFETWFKLHLSSIITMALVQPQFLKERKEEEKSKDILEAQISCSGPNTLIP